MQKYLLGLDNGGTLVKAALFDFEGEQKAVASQGIPLITPQPGFTERNLDEIWKANASCVKNLLKKYPVKAEEIAGIAISGHGKGLYMIGDEKEPNIYNGILSTDSRAWEYVDRWYADGTADKVYEKNFQGIMAVQPVALLAWLKDHHPEVLKKCRWIFSAKDYVRYRLTGEVYAEYTDCSGSNLLNMTTKAYDRDLLALFGLEDLYEKLPPLKYSADICGHLTAQAAQDMGLAAGIPVAGGMFDIDACGIAVGMVNEDQLCMIAGTWSINEYIAKTPVTNKSVMLNSLFCMPGYYLIEESSPTSAGNLEWFIQNFMPGASYEELSTLAASVPPGQNSLIFLPFLNGSNENALGKGTFIGMTGYHGRQHMVRAVYEGVAFSHLTHVNKLLKNRTPPASIRLAGGVARSDVWVQIFADVMQLPIDIIADVELGCLGAAMVAGIAAGVYGDYQKASARVTKITKTIQPNPAMKSVYEKKYAVYRAVVEALNPVWKHFPN